MEKPVFINPDRSLENICDAKSLWKSGRFKPDQTFEIFRIHDPIHDHRVSAR
jgi:hypothetical protein